MLQACKPLSLNILAKTLRLSSSSPTRRPTQSFSCKMSSDSPPLTHSITLPGQLAEPVQIVAAPNISPSEFRSAIDSSLFKQWLKNMESESGVLSGGGLFLKRVLIQGVDLFGNRIGFLKFVADVIDKETGKKVRIPVGRIILELPAGMLDDDKGDFLGTAIREVEEETGICLKQKDLVDLTAFLDESTGRRIFPSPGGCDEEISLFLYRGPVDKGIIEQLQGKETGLREHGELIKLCVVPYEKLWCTTADAKVLAALTLYEMAKREGLLPPPKA
ncbi:nudix hydrolase 14, chloroplastic isoform X2 [Pyrus x bretschneideri]|uniref:nudix hydrolase 14, chloroplastic isoform X2 n=1 Tax=Pyrus x bretschneideri TaxID=225117 RepID=UPI002030C03E|nr:nudix hydrolase 14, chloroplastic isoform X2 [Pyrus x bretschneideri]